MHLSFPLGNLILPQGYLAGQFWGEWGMHRVYFLTSLLQHHCSFQEEDEDFEEESDDDTADLLAELEKIKKERAEEQARKVITVLTIFISLSSHTY